jgi:hypothetical protein
VTRSRARSAALFVLGLVLVGAAVWAVVAQREALRAGVEAARSAPAGLVVLALVLPVVNLVLISAVFWVLTGRYGTVSRREMGALIASAWLLNTLPIRAGFLGRVAYHKAVNGIALRDSVRVVIESLVCGLVAVAGLIGAVVLARAAGAPGWVAPLAGAAATLPMFAAGVVLARRSGGGQAWRWPVAAGLRMLDVLVWVIRYAVTFRIVGHAIDWPGAVTVAATSQVAMLAPVQFGLREWVVGLTSAALAERAVAGEPLARLAPGLMADLFNRASELVVGVPIGVVATLWVASRWKQRRAMSSV